MRKIVIFIIFLFFVLLTEKSTAGELNSCPRVLASPNGRYVLGQISIVREDQFLLDTKTGRVWRIVVDPQTNVTLLEPVFYIYPFSDGKIGVLPESIKEAQKIKSNLNLLKEISKNIENEGK